MRIIFATANRGKLREAAEVLGPGFEVVSPADLGITEDIPETGATLQENSLQKAQYVFDRTGLPCFADDTGLEVAALGGAPGICSARYAGPGHDSEANMDKLLAELIRLDDRRARFRTVVTLILADGQPHFFEGSCEGSSSCGSSSCKERERGSEGCKEKGHGGSRSSKKGKQGPQKRGYKN